MNLSQVLPVPGLVWGAYPERAARPGAPWWLVSLEAALPGWLSRQGERCSRRLHSALATAKARGVGEFSVRLGELRQSLARRKLSEALIVESFVLIDAVCQRELGLRPHDAQFAAARLMLEGRVVEMATGEGKTLAALLAAATAALAGVPVHVITANDYLAARDALTLRKVYAALGLRVGAVTHAQTAERRRDAYGCDVTYCTAKELVFDYLRDGLAREGGGGELERRAARLAGSSAAPERPALLRGLCMAIVDEADSILIDEAGVPFVLSQAFDNAGERGFYEHALGLARTLEAPRDYRIKSEPRVIELTRQGRDKLVPQPQAGKAVERNRRHREESVVLALTALHVLQRDRDYLVSDGKVVIIEPTTGRAARGRAWSRGLHQLVELKEGAVPTLQPATLTQITYQRFFPRYLRLCGMSGTAQEARAELLAVYGCRVARVPLRNPCRRSVLQPRLFLTVDERWRAVVERVMHMHAKGRPVLVGTGSVAESEELSRRLAACGLPHAVLNARYDATEAALVAAAGQPGRVTVTTNMAGRGTDVVLGAGVAEAGGLHVILCQHNASRRIDRQLFGRCARRGEPGSCEAMLCLSDLTGLFWATRLLKDAYGLRQSTLPRWLAGPVLRLVAWREDRRQRAQRRLLCDEDARAERNLPRHPRRPSMEARSC
jgi:preprotein translocase subunit SecA